MASSYRSEYPSGIAVDAGIQEFFEKFYDISDTPNIHEKYVNSFTKDATFILATKVSKGHDGKRTQFTWCQIVQCQYRSCPLSNPANMM
jgi:hypothetical protein